MNLELNERIMVDPRIRSGKPCINGTRIAVAEVLEYLRGGMTISQILEDFPDLTAESISAVLEYPAAK